MFVLEVSGHIYRPADTGRCIKADSSAEDLIKATPPLSAFNKSQSPLIHQHPSASRGEERLIPGDYLFPWRTYL